MSETERKVGVTERLLAAIVDIQHYITHGAEPLGCAACPRWDELQSAAVAIVGEVERLKALIVSQHEVVQWAEDGWPVAMEDHEQQAIEAIVQEAQEREQREVATKGGTR